MGPSRVGAPNRTFGFLLLLSGFCGISYEILYARMLGNLVGDQFAVYASILLTFLLGIGVGTLYAHRLWRHLWLIEASIGGYGVFFALGTGLFDRAIYAAVPVLGTGLATSMLVCLALLCPPAFLIGCSLPLFAGYLSRLAPGRVFARAYTIYNFGAALTTLVIEFALIRLAGLELAVITIASINVAVALALLFGYGELRRMRPEPASYARFPARSLTALAVASVASAVFQLLMVRIAECLFGPFHETFALVLALILLGIAFGAILTEKWRLTFTHAMLLAVGGLLLLLSGFSLMTRVIAFFYFMVDLSYALGVFYKITMLAILMGIPAMAFGSTIPALLTEQRHVARESGQLLFISSLANAFGFLLMAFVLHRNLDYGAIVLTVLILSALALTIHLAPRGRRAGAVGLLVVLAAGAHAAFWEERLLFLGYRAFLSPNQLRQAKSRVERTEKFKGYHDVFSINWTDGEPWMFINGYNSINLSSPSETLVGALSSMFSPRTDNALVLGLGSGATAGTVGLLFDRTDAVEINPVIVKNLSRMKEYNFDIENQAGTRIFTDDGMHFVKTTDEKYSLVINTVTTPLYFSSSKLYTRDFLERIRDRLTPDGVYVTWMDAGIGDLGADIITKTVTETFSSCWIASIKSSYFLLLCSPGEIELRRPDLAARNETLRAYFARHLLNADWLPYAVVTPDLASILDRSEIPLNTLDHPVLEFEMARVGERGFDGFRRRLVSRMTLEDLEEALAPALPLDPVHLVVHAETIYGRRPLYEHWKSLVASHVPDLDRRQEASRLAMLESFVRRYDAASIHHEYGSALLASGRPAEAIEQLTRALELEPGRRGVRFHLGYAHERLGDRQRALEAYADELALDPEHAETLYRRSLVFLSLGRYDDALAELDRALSITDWGEIHLARGQAMERLERTGEAIDSYRRALEKPATRERAGQALRRLEGR